MQSPLTSAGNISFYPVPAVIIAAGELSLNFDYVPLAGTAFPGRETFGCHHTIQRRSGEMNDKSIRVCDDGQVPKQALKGKCENYWTRAKNGKMSSYHCRKIPSFLYCAAMSRAGSYAIRTYSFTIRLEEKWGAVLRMVSLIFFTHICGIPFSESV